MLSRPKRPVTESNVPAIDLKATLLPSSQRSAALPWARKDTIAISALTLIALLTRFWRLGYPPVMIFDEDLVVPWARCYLRGLPYANHHPPLPPLLIALSILAFGDKPWAWRVPSAILGVSLVAVTYLLGRRMLNSRLVGAIAAALIVGSGLFLVHSRIGIHEIFYLTFAACSYLMLFRFAADPSPPSQRQILVWMGIALGLCAASKLLIPAATELLVLSFLVLLTVHSAHRDGLDVRAGLAAPLRRQVGGSLALVGGLSALVYLTVFAPNYWFGWWRGIGDQLSYYHWILRTDTGLGPHGHPNDSPWWSWPLMLRPILYWENKSFFVRPDLPIAAIKAMDNPAICWAALAAIPVVTMQAIAGKNTPRAFLAIGFALYLAMWIPITRFTFLYHYMPALYLGFLALAVVLAECWRGRSRMWEEALLLASLIPSLVLGLGTRAGLATGTAIGASWLVLARSGQGKSGKFVCILLGFAVIALFGYFFPVWFGLPISQAEMLARTWLRGPGLANWY